MSTPKLLFINGAAGVGKTTLAQKYIDEHPLALIASTDGLVGAMGQWLTHEAAAQQLAFDLIKVMVTHHLAAGYDVVVPHLLARPEEAAALESIAKAAGADFFECVLIAPKSESVRRMLERGTWGEPGSPPVTQNDTPIIEDLFDKVELALEQRPNAVRISAEAGEIEATYAKLIAAVAAQTN